MCGIFTAPDQMELEKVLELAKVLKEVVFPAVGGEIFPRYNAPIIRANDEGEIVVDQAEFSLVPHWFDAEKYPATSKGRPKMSTFNAVLEEVTEKNSYRDAFEKHPCLVPMLSFVEPSRFGKYNGNMIRLSPKDKQIIFAAGIFSIWKPAQNVQSILTFSLLTVEAPEQVEEAGHHRCPDFVSLDSGIKHLTSTDLTPKKRQKFLMKSFAPPIFDIEIEREMKLKTDKQKKSDQLSFELDGED